MPNRQQRHSNNAKPKPATEERVDAVIVVVGRKDPRDLDAGEKERRRLHGSTFAGMVYSQQVKTAMNPATFTGDSALPNDMLATSCMHVMDLVHRMKPVDDLERMLIQQAIWTHARIGRLSQLVSHATLLDHTRVLNDAADKATNTYRRLMLALAEYRRPPKTESHTTITQANIAGQQIVQNDPESFRKPKNETNEKGFPDDHEPASQSTPALPSLATGPDFATGINSASKAVGTNMRASNS